MRGGGGRGDGGASRGSVLTLSASGLALLATTLQSSEKLTLLARNASQKNQDCFGVICCDYNHVQDDMNVFVLVIKNY